MHTSSSRGWFDVLAQWASQAAGRPLAFGLAAGLVLAWAATGPIFGFSDTWQLVVNTGTTIVTFLMVFLIQSSQNRDTAAMQVKLDELIRAVEGARNDMIDLEDLTEEQLVRIRARYHLIGEDARRELEEAEENVEKFTESAAREGATPRAEA